MSSVASPRQSTTVARQPNLNRQNGTGSASEQSKTPAKAAASTRSAPLRLKAIVRRLPPGLTEDEFQAILGPDWSVGGERVDWYTFKQGKVTRDAAKLSVPGRAYLNLTTQEYLDELATVVRSADFTDVKNTTSDPCLLGAPVLEMAPHGRIPTLKPRKDARQGTIDQDSEFMSFLQGLTNPIIKPAAIDAVEKEGNKPSAEMVTPLIQYLRDKKANKEKSKDQASSKGGKQGRSEGKDSKNQTSEKTGGGKSKSAKESAGGSGADKKNSSSAKGEKTVREPVRVLSKSTNAQKANQNANVAANKAPVASVESQPSTVPVERKQRKVGAEAKSLLQRDLGIGGSRRGRRGEAGTSNATGSAKPGSRRQSVSAQVQQSNTSISEAAVQNPSKVAQSSSSSKSGGNAPSVEKQNTALGKTNANPQSSSQVTQQPRLVPSAPTQAFLKHANASQGITESALQIAMSSFGAVNKIDIDKKKGFAYIDFTEPESLKRAIAASPVKVGQGSVVVLERKEKAPKQEKTNKTQGGNGNATPQSPITASSGNEKPNASPNNTSASSGNAASSGTNRGGGNRSHRPRGNRGRGPGRGTGEKGAAAQQQGKEATGTTNIAASAAAPTAATSNVTTAVSTHVEPKPT